MRHTTFFAAFFTAFFLFCIFTGCGTAPPADLPPLASCKVKIHNNGSPLTKIGVSFQRVDGHGGWSLNGVTGSDGIAVAKTNAGSYSANGIPTGTYRVTLSERIELPPELIDDNDPSMPTKQQKYIDEHRTLPKTLCDPLRTPLELTVTESGAELDVDIAKFK